MGDGILSEIMRLRRIVTIFTLFMLVILYTFFLLFRQTTVLKRDIVYYNDLMYKIEADIASGRDIEAIENQYACNIIYSKQLNDPELAELYSKEAFVLDLVVDGDYLGKVAWLDKQEKQDFYGGQFLTYSLFIWIAVLLMGYGVILVVYLSYIRPVNDLKSFSEELAKGNLDASLPIRRNNLFGGFSEAFDIMREELKNSQKRRIEAEIARKELVSSLSHDVKTPVAVIEATCEVLDVKFRRRLAGLNEDGEAFEEEFKEINDSLEKINVITSKTHTIQSIMADLIHSNLEDSEKVSVLPVEEYSTYIEDYFKRIANYGNIILENHIPSCLIYMDRQRMEQVIDNIVGNSVKYAGTDIHVFFDEINDMLMPDGSSGGFVRIRIKDSGPGVDEDDLPLLAQKYYRGANSEGQNGYGMGMYLVKQYMLKQGGDMEYFNDNGFVVVLMLKKV
ncbi:Histidine kinase-, DNA gyrase B-, and HSP90-like ATPase [Lachnospiraceae bacterium XBB2008]|nr:Histidine kinase-, DNA gyrase B-, and HSP90-like ATPase [Lachnospiraceae bacterium XBB2008]